MDPARDPVHHPLQDKNNVLCWFFTSRNHWKPHCHLDLLDIALDIVGIPQDNSANFDFDYLNGVSTPDPNRRNDFNNMFCRDRWDSIGYELKKEHIDSIVEQLYKDYDELILEQPHLFIKK